MDNIDRTQYPALDQILWDVHVRYIPAKAVLSYYERRWAYVDETSLEPDERALIEGLTKRFGNNVFLAAK